MSHHPFSSDERQAARVKQGRGRIAPGGGVYFFIFSKLCRPFSPDSHHQYGADKQDSGTFVQEAGGDATFRIDLDVNNTQMSVLRVIELRRTLKAEMAALAAERRTPEQMQRIREALELDLELKVCEQLCSWSMPSGSRMCRAPALQRSVIWKMLPGAYKRLRSHSHFRN